MGSIELAVMRYERSPDSLMETIQACKGLSGLRPGDRVLIKPNLVGWDDNYPVPPYGVYTTSRMVEDMLSLLKDAGAAKITIGEGSVRNNRRVSTTEIIYSKFGYLYFKERYGVELVDLLDGHFTEVKAGWGNLSMSTLALEADFFINMPVLKTHNVTKVSLGLKNLKGCLHMRSRKFCHQSDHPLDFYCSLFAEVIRPSLTVLDGIYGLERGPFVPGTAYRFDTLIASRDALAVDIAGAKILGFDGKEVPHIFMCAERMGRSTSLEGIFVTGVALEEMARPLKWDFEWREDNSGPKMWDRLGITGISLPKYDQTLCSGCAALYNPLLMMITSAYQEGAFHGMEVLTGKMMRHTKGFPTTVLFGNCAIKAHRRDGDIEHAVLVPGCPPSVEKIVDKLRGMGLRPSLESYRGFRRSLLERYDGDVRFDPNDFYLPGSRPPQWD